MIQIFHIPIIYHIDVKLIGGSVLFGIGWGLEDYALDQLWQS